MRSSEVSLGQKVMGGGWDLAEMRPVTEETCSGRISFSFEATEVLLVPIESYGAGEQPHLVRDGKRAFSG